MRKEVFLAIFAGVAAGLVLAFGAWRLTSNLKKDNNPDPGNDQNPTQTASPVNKSSLSVAISGPDNLSVVTASPTKISGLTKPESIVIISTDDKDYMTKSTDKGSFEQSVALSGGLNNIAVTVFDQQGSSANTNLDLIYSSEFAKFMENDNQNSDATSSAETIREKVQQKLSATLNKPTAYIGTITDLTDTTIQVRSEGNGIQQISISDETTYSSDEDLAIGDFIIAMGFVNSNKVLDTKRIVTSDDNSPNKTKALWATISTVKGKEVTFTIPGGSEEFDITFPKTWVGPDIDELSESENYILTGDLADSTLSLRSIFEIK